MIVRFNGFLVNGFELKKRTIQGLYLDACILSQWQQSVDIG